MKKHEYKVEYECQVHDIPLDKDGKCPKCEYIKKRKENVQTISNKGTDHKRTK